MLLKLRSVYVQSIAHFHAKLFRKLILSDVLSDIS